MPRLFSALRPFQRALPFSAVLSVTAILVASLAACGDTPSLLAPASVENVDRQYGVYALTGSPAGLPAAYQFTTESLVRPQVLGNGALNFDVAFDITADGKALILPARLVSPVPPTAVAPVGFQHFPGVYEQITVAPKTGFVDDASVALDVGEAIYVRLSGSGCYFNEPYYGKLTVDSINVAERRLLIRTLVNRNCGYRSLVTGIPTN